MLDEKEQHSYYTSFPSLFGSHHNEVLVVYIDILRLPITIFCWALLFIDPRHLYQTQPTPNLPLNFHSLLEFLECKDSCSLSHYSHP